MTGQPIAISIQALTVETFEPFGWVLGKPFAGASVSFANAVTDFRSEHIFDPGQEGRPEILWVSYRNSASTLDELEVHHLTQQAIVPIAGGDIIHVVAASDRDGNPDLSTATAFHVRAGTGVCMRSGTWHATRVQEGDDVVCLMLTRQSTTRDLIDHLNSQRKAVESAMQAIPTIRLIDSSDLISPHSIAPSPPGGMPDM